LRRRFRGSHGRFRRFRDFSVSIMMMPLKWFFLWYLFFLNRWIHRTNVRTGKSAEDARLIFQNVQRAPPQRRFSPHLSSSHESPPAPNLYKLPTIIFFYKEGEFCWPVSHNRKCSLDKWSQSYCQFVTSSLDSLAHGFQVSTTPRRGWDSAHYVHGEL
jgi:hypothetical protein